MFLSLPNSKIEVDNPLYFQAPLKPAKDESVIPDMQVDRSWDDIGDKSNRELSIIRTLI
ncbi:MAG: hypothetical protein KA746_03660 [Pyrinomonadaceae bacterium]|nr:hypothetical protein [Pyrinomonadaceae bacterium]MBP6213145.1 hypothetical protein [Pyrinomonadaceae bacterium]